VTSVLLGTPSQAWWRPPRAAAPATAVSTSRVAFQALVAFTAILLLAPQAWFPILGTLRIAFVVAAIAIGAHLVTQILRARDVPPMPAEIVLAFVLAGWAVLTLPLSIWPGGSVAVLTDRYLKAVAFFWLIGTLATSPTRLRVLVWTFVLGTVPLAATGIKNYMTGEVLSTGVAGFTRVAGYVGGSNIAANPNDLALVLNLIIPLAAALVVLSRGAGLRLVAGVALLLAVVGVVLTFSRAGFLALAATMLVSVAYLARRGAHGRAAALAIAALLALPLLPDSYVGRLNTITNIEEDETGSAQGRWRDTKLAAAVVAKNPIIGAGIGNDVLVMNDERGRDTWRRVHNVYLQYGVDLGLPGMLLFIALHATCYGAARDAERRGRHDPALADLVPLAVAIKVSLIAFAVEAMFHPIAYNFYFFAMGGLAVALRAAAHGEAGLQARSGTHA
jgi:probable O-glycosylation ligase (exosortase A-associated)